MKKFTFLFTLLITAASLHAQKEKQVLLTIDDNPVYAKEFKQVYKKNLELVQEENQKSVDGYLDLFIDYKLKVTEAYAENLHEKDTYKRDLSKYEDQLARNYIYEDQVTEDLIKEAYERGKEEIRASHILIMCNFDALAQDTLAAYNKIKKIRERALKGEDFSTLAATTSEEPNASTSKGDLGYFSVFGMVYPFESMAYNTPKGEISEIVRTQFGYHILKIEDRREKLPEVSVSHIMISTMNGADEAAAEKKINEIFAFLEQGENFEDLARQYSDDKNTGRKGGRMRPFSKGDLKAEPFENAAYALKNEGDISVPIKTRFGWHIIKLHSFHELPAFEDQRMSLEKRVKNGDRSKIVTNAVNNQIKERLDYKIVNPYQPYFYQYVSDSVVQAKWEYTPVPEKDNKVLFTAGTGSFYFDQFAEYIDSRQRFIRPHRKKETLLATLFDEFETKMLKQQFRDDLEAQNPEYANIIREYRDGLLIFEVMGRNVWDKAKYDTIGQEQYFENNIAKYQWKQRAKLVSFSAGDRSSIEMVQKMMQEGKTSEEIKKSMNTDDKVQVILTEGTFEEGAKEFPKNYAIQKGVSDIYEVNNSYVVLNVSEVIPPGPKAFDEIKGRVLSDYQNDLEKSWMQGLRDKYKVDVNKKTLKKVKKELES